MFHIDIARSRTAERDLKSSSAGHPTWHLNPIEIAEPEFKLNHSASAKPTEPLLSTRHSVHSLSGLSSILTS